MIVHILLRSVVQRLAYCAIFLSYLVHSFLVLLSAAVLLLLFAAVAALLCDLRLFLFSFLFFHGTSSWWQMFDLEWSSSVKKILRCFVAIAG